MCRTEILLPTTFLVPSPKWRVLPLLPRVLPNLSSPMSILEPSSSSREIESGPSTRQCDSHHKRRMTGVYRRRELSLWSEQQAGNKSPKRYCECLRALPELLSPWCPWRGNLYLRETSGKKRDYGIIPASGSILLLC